MKLTNLKDKNQFKFFMNLKKTDLRRKLRLVREGLSDDEMQQNSQVILENIIALTIFKKAQKVGLYYPIKNEVNLLGLLKIKNKQFYLPRIASQNKLEFHQIESLDEMQINPYGIPEPKSSSTQSLDLLIVPMLGFDLNGQRLGYGKGYYDRYLSQGNRPFCVGVAFDCQCLEALPTESHDIQMDLIITEKRVIKIMW